MAELIFDEAIAQNLYQRYLAGDTSAIWELIIHSRELVEVLAAKCSEEDHWLWLDLISEGEMKIYDLCRKKQYQVGRGKLHSFLTVAITNRMLSYVKYYNRRTYSAVPLEEDRLIAQGYCAPSPEQYVIMRETMEEILAALNDLDKRIFIALLGCNELVSRRFESTHRQNKNIRNRSHLIVAKALSMDSKPVWHSYRRIKAELLSRKNGCLNV